MLELVFIACLKSSPGVCEERVLAHLAESGAVACIVRAQPELAQWVRAHPAYTVTRWHCRVAGSGPFEA